MTNRPFRFRFAHLLLIGLIPTWACASSGATETPEVPSGGELSTRPQQPAAPVADEPADDPAPEGGPFTDTQADRGRTSFRDVCAECHTTSEFRDRTFQRQWGRRNVYTLFRAISTTMPDDQPGGLDEQTYYDVVAYILEMNGHLAGGIELQDVPNLRDIRVAPPEGSR